MESKSGKKRTKTREDDNQVNVLAYFHVHLQSSIPSADHGSVFLNFFFKVLNPVMLISSEHNFDSLSA